MYLFSSFPFNLIERFESLIYFNDALSKHSQPKVKFIENLEYFPMG